MEHGRPACSRQGVRAIVARPAVLLVAQASTYMYNRPGSIRGGLSTTVCLCALASIYLFLYAIVDRAALLGAIWSDLAAGRFVTGDYGKGLLKGQVIGSKNNGRPLYTIPPIYRHANVNRSLLSVSAKELYRPTSFKGNESIGHSSDNHGPRSPTTKVNRSTLFEYKAFSPKGTVTTLGPGPHNGALVLTSTQNRSSLSNFTRSSPTPAVVRRPYRLYIQPVGGLGNQLFQFAAVIGVAASTGRTPVVTPVFVRTLNMFNLTLDVQYPLPDIPWVTELNFATFSKEVYNQPKSDALLVGFFQSWRYFTKSQKDLRRHLTIKRSLTSQTDAIKEKACETICFRKKNLIGAKRYSFPNYSFCDCSSQTYIGVHLRLKNIKPNYNQVPVNYMEKAFNFFRRRHKNITFLVVSDNITWCEEKIKGKDVYVVSDMPPDVHFTILSSCDHHVISVGTFGWWAAWLGGGTTVYYDTPISESFSLRAQFKSQDYFPQNWIPMH